MTQLLSDLSLDPKYWRERAEEARMIAENLTDPLMRGTMKGVAKAYDELAHELAQRVEEQSRGEAAA